MRLDYSSKYRNESKSWCHKHASLTKTQKGQRAPHRADTVLSSSAAGVSEDEEMGHNQAQGDSWQDLRPASPPPPSDLLDPSSKKQRYKNTLAFLRHIKELIIKQSWRRKLILETHEVTIFFFSWRWGGNSYFRFHPGGTGWELSSR